MKILFVVVMRYITIIFGTIWLQGCNSLHIFQPDSERIQAKAWTRYGERPRVEKVYCYRTLGEPQCYRELQKDKEHLLLNHQRASVDDAPRDALWFFNIQDPSK